MSEKFNFRELMQWVKAILFAVVLAFLIRGFIFEPVIVQGESMSPTLTTGERLIVYKLGYFFSEPERGDIIVLQYQQGLMNKIPLVNNLPIFKKILPAINELDYIKRVIGEPGDEVDIKEGSVFVNGEKLDESYTKGFTSPRAMKFPVTVPEDSVMVLGDNRENSRDSREIGYIEFDRIKGKAVFRFLPMNSFGKIE